MIIGIPEKIWSTVKDHVPLATPTKEESVVELLEKLGIPKWGQLIPGKIPRSPASLYRYYRLQIFKEDGSVVTANFDLDYNLPPQGETLPSPWDW